VENSPLYSNGAKARNHAWPEGRRAGAEGPAPGENGTL